MRIPPIVRAVFMLVVACVSITLTLMSAVDLIQGNPRHSALRYAVRMVLCFVYAWYAFDRWRAIRKELQAQHKPATEEG